MKKTIAALALAAVVPATVLAATDGRGPGHRGPDVARMAERLDLTPEQREEVRSLLEAHRAEREAMRERMRASMAQVLTPEQQARMQALREERRDHRKRRRHGRDCEGAGKGS